MALTDKEREIVQWGKDNGKSLIETKAALSRYRNEQAVKPIATLQKATPQTNMMDKAAGALDTVFGGGKIGEAIGTQIAKARATPEEKALIEGPGVKEVAGDVLRVGSTFLPVGKIAGAISRGAKALGIGAKTAQTAGKIAGGATVGATADVGVSMADGGDAQIGLGTILGAGIPAASPILGAISRASAKIAGRGATELTGKLTGTSQETVEQAFLAAKQGGKDLNALTNALRGKTTPEQLVNNMRESVDLVAKNRSQLFAETLSELGDNVVQTAPAKENFKKTLESVGITVNENGALDFSKNKLRNVTDAQDKITKAWLEISSMPETLSIKDLDTTRQAVKTIKSIAGESPAANLGNMLIEDAVRSVRLAGEQVDGYGKMLDNFGETSEFLDEIGRALSTGDKATVDTAYRKIATSLKTNNEQRMALVKELDDATEGALLADIAGQQLSEALPRGLIGTYLAPIVAGGAIAGGVSPAILPGLLLASPRAVGEVARALGIGTAKTEALIDAVAQAKDLLIKAGALTGTEVDNATD